jgi:hypothetical protein
LLRSVASTAIIASEPTPPAEQEKKEAAETQEKPKPEAKVWASRHQIRIGGKAIDTGLVIAGRNAVSVDSVDHYLACGDAKGAPELLQATVKVDELTSMLTQAVVAEGAKAKRHAFRAGAARDAGGAGELRLALRPPEPARRTNHRIGVRNGSHPECPRRTGRILESD